VPEQRGEIQLLGERRVHLGERGEPPLAGREGKFVTSRQIGERLRREALGNVSIRIEPTESPEIFEVAARGEMQIGVLVEEMRRESYEFTVSRPEIITREVYGGDGVEFLPPATRAIADIEASGYGDTPVCIAKTQYSLSDDPALLGRPKGFHIVVREVQLSAGAGFVVALAGEIMTMPGLPKVPSAAAIRVRPDGQIEGLF